MDSQPALRAGSYWRNVRTSERESFESHYSLPSAFTIPATERVVSVRFRRNSYTYVPDDLEIRVRWTTNAR